MITYVATAADEQHQPRQRKELLEIGNVDDSKGHHRHAGDHYRDNQIDDADHLPQERTDLSAETGRKDREPQSSQRREGRDEHE